MEDEEHPESESLSRWLTTGMLQASEEARDERLPKLQRRDSSSTVPRGYSSATHDELWTSSWVESLPTPSCIPNLQKEQLTVDQDNTLAISLQPPSPLSNNISAQQIDKPERKPAIAPQSKSVNERENGSFEWIPSLSDEIESRSRSTSTDRGRPRSVSPSTSASSRDVKPHASKAVNYVTILETKDCFMGPSATGPTPEDVAPQSIS
ncbi:hypothetical protein AOCH_001487 [Aspergillus ochraceoroseus]|uniref:Uncharacterized protein n=1 Tax=Aspergillus ochraceoroseus TaxID=138278 RepID=A0A0F8URV3_9EURO|nr:hypothetical protein AOCH_001487 [Aspergillus ochraceoroseus]